MLGLDWPRVVCEQLGQGLKIGCLIEVSFMATFTLTSFADDFPKTGQDVSGYDVIYGLNGDDRMSGGAGANTLYGGEGQDIIY